MNSDESRDCHELLMPAPAKHAIYNREPLPFISNVVAVASGKGGVGKSTTAVCIAHALAAQGKRVGILDADIHGPSIPRMLGVQHSGQPEIKDGQMLPIIGHGIKSMSMGNIANDQAAIWRGPMVSKALTQMLRTVRWGTQTEPLDVLLIDMPPGTGDIHLTIAQAAPIDRAIVVTTPQEMATADAQKCIIMFEKLNIPIAGVIENMSYFIDPTGAKHAIFGQGGGEALAQKHDVAFLGSVALEPAIRAAMDAGVAPVLSEELKTLYSQALL